MANKRVLIVEDDLLWGDILTEAMRKRGYEVTWFVRAELLGENGVKLTDPDGKVFVLHACEYDIALVDGRLKTSNLNGWDLTPAIVKAGLPVIALSGADYFNDLMIKAGAQGKLAKDQLLRDMVNGRPLMER